MVNEKIEVKTREVISLDGKTPVQIVQILDAMQRTKGHEFIRDNVTKDMVEEMKKDKVLYQTFQDIKKECKQSYDYDNSFAKMKDVDRACTNLYSIILRLMKGVIADNDGRFNEIQLAINTLEEHMGIEKTVWGGDKNDENVEGVKENN